MVADDEASSSVPRKGCEVWQAHDLCGYITGKMKNEPTDGRISNLRRNGMEWGEGGVLHSEQNPRHGFKTEV